MRLFTFVCIAFATFHPGVAGPTQSPNEKLTPSRTVQFKSIGAVALRLHVFDPPQANNSPAKSAIIFFFGGGWVNGTPAQFYPQCQHLADRGMLAMAAEYRVGSRHGTTPWECVRDGKSAVRWVRSHAAQLGVDPHRIVAAGGSAGGHVAACTALIRGMNDEPTTVSCEPNALVLFNPVIDTGPAGFGYQRLGEDYHQISPLEHVRPGIPPVLILQGLADTTTPAAGHREFARRMHAAKNVCQLKLFAGQKHGFFNPGRGNGSGFQETTEMMDEFLSQQGFLSSQETGSTQESN